MDCSGGSTYSIVLVNLKEIVQRLYIYKTKYLLKLTSILLYKSKNQSYTKYFIGMRPTTLL